MATAETVMELVNNYCTRIHTEPAYNFMNTDGPADAPRFTMLVTVGSDFTGVGKGYSLHSARQNAVASMLERVVNDGKHVDWGFPVNREEAMEIINKFRISGEYELIHSRPDPATEKVQLANAVARLESMFTGKGKKSPQYVDISDSGAPGYSTIKVILGNGITTIGIGRSKKQAKRIAALKAIEKLNEMQDVGCLPETENAPVTYAAEVKSEPITDDAGDETWDEPVEDILSRFDFSDIPRKGPDSESLFYETSNTDHLDLLQTMCEQKGWKYTFTENVNGESERKIVFLNLPEDRVFGGCGKDLESAKCVAAHSALIYFRMIDCKPE